MFIVVGLSGFVAYGADTSKPPADLKRNYTTVLKDAMGKMLITIDYRYIGKRPQGNYPTKPHDWKKIDTDFYQKTLTNHTGYVVEFLTMETWPERETGELAIKTEKGMKKKSSRVTLDLTKMWRNNKVGPYSAWKQTNFYYYSRGKNWNVRHCVLTIKINGVKYKLHDKLVYIK